MGGHNFFAKWGAGDVLIDDPGDGGKIKLGANAVGMCSIVSAGVETRLIEDPESACQLLMLNFETDGGNVVIDANHPTLNAAADQVITLADVRDFIVLISVPAGAGYRWQVLSDQGSVTSGS